MEIECPKCKQPNPSVNRYCTNCGVPLPDAETPTNHTTPSRKDKPTSATDKIVLDCQKCGGSLTITEEVDLFKCQYCGTPYMVKREAGTLRIIRLERRVDHLEAGHRKLAEGVGAMVHIDEVRAKREEVEGERGFCMIMGCVAIGGVILFIAVVLIWPFIRDPGEHDQLLGLAVMQFVIPLAVVCLIILLVVAAYLRRRKPKLDETIRQERDMERKIKEL